MAEHHSLFHQAINDPNHNDTADDDSDVEVTCPACDFQLNADAHFETYRICPNCQRHFWLPARERLALFVDRDSFRETNTEVISVDPVVFRDPLPLPDRMAGTRESAAAAINEALLTGIATIGGREAMVAIVDFAHLGGSIGMLAGEKITLAIEAATNRRLPFIAVCAGGGSRTQEGMLSLLQMARIANAVGRLQRKGLPFISVLTHPTIGPLYSGLACHANIILAEPGSHIGLLGDRGRGTAMPDDSAVSTAEALLQRGMLDAIVDRSVLRDRLSGLLDLILSRGTPRDSTIAAVSPTSTRRASEELTLAHHPDRPGASLYLDRLLSRFVELHGDRVGADDRTVIAGLGQIDGVSVCVIATDRQSNDGQITAAGFRKAERLHQLAASLELPVLQLIDTPGATTMGDPHSITLGMVMAQSLRGAESLPVPIVTVITGEAGGAAALSFGAPT